MSSSTTTLQRSLAQWDEEIRARILKPMWAIDSQSFNISAEVKAVFVALDGLKAENAALKAEVERLGGVGYTTDGDDEGDDEDSIDDGYGNRWDKICAECGKPTMHVVRPGKAQCDNCG